MNFSDIHNIGQIKTLVITGSQNRDEDLLGTLHKLGLRTSVTTYQKTTINQIKSNMAISSERYNLIIILDDEDFDGFEVAKVSLGEQALRKFCNDNGKLKRPEGELS